MHITNESNADGIRELSFELNVAAETVRGILWLPDTGPTPLPLLLAAHGGGQHKLFAPFAAYAKASAQELQAAVVAIDAPGHGERATNADAEALAGKLRQQLAAGGGIGAGPLAQMLRLATQAAAEWQAVLDAVQALPCVGEGGKVGFLGMSLGGMTGLLLAAAEPRITAAVCGLVGIGDPMRVLEQAARRITIPLRFVAQWDDQLVPWDSSRALFEALASPAKSLHAHAGGHLNLPPEERAQWRPFFRRHLVSPTAPPP
jgi:pimeloyl-ACP methyl ester carboxylesterase